MIEETGFLVVAIFLTIVFFYALMYLIRWIIQRPKKCPQRRICRNENCKRKAWCKKYKRNTEKIIHYHEIKKEKKKRARKRY